MKPASISELKKALAQLDEDELRDACLRLAKFKVDNKSLLTYLLMKSDNEQAYVDEVCDEIDEMFPLGSRIPKKTMRKIIRWFDKCIRYSGDKETELQIRIYFCRQFAERQISFGNCKISSNMYLGQIKKINLALEKLHPDLQFDFRQKLAGLD